MRKNRFWLLPIAFVLGVLSLVTYGIHFIVFRDSYHIFFYLLLDVGFLFLNVLVVIIFIERLLARREKRALFEKLNMVIGAFFSEVGLNLTVKLLACLTNQEDLKGRLDIRPSWMPKDFRNAMAAAKVFRYNMAIAPPILRDLRTFLGEKRDFMVRLLENPILMEHDRFTDVLWAVFHLAEELSFREGSLDGLPPADLKHLEADAQRALSLITVEWLAHFEHLKGNYPYLFSLAVRINPLGENPSATVKET